MFIDLTEAAWQRIVVAIARVNGWTVGTTSSSHSDPGVPDLTLIHPSGRLIFAELKGHTGHPSTAQRRTLAALRTADVEAYLWRPEDRGEVEEVLGGRRLVAGAVDDRATVASIVAHVARHYGFTVADLTGPERTAAVSRARWVAMAAVRDLTGASYPAIGAAFRRSHTTVIHGLRRLALDPALVQTRGVICSQLATGPDPAETGETAEVA